jgi:hypothetical protein
LRDKTQPTFVDNPESLLEKYFYEDKKPENLTPSLTPFPCKEGGFKNFSPTGREVWRVDKFFCQNTKVLSPRLPRCENLLAQHLQSTWFSFGNS